MFNISAEPRVRTAPIVFRVVRALFLIAVPAVEGQTPVASPHPEMSKRPPSCLDTLSVTGMPRVPVYVTAQLNDSTPKSIASSADFLAQSVPERIREMLGHHPDTLPIGEPAITWRGLETLLEITVHRNGPLTFDTVGATAYWRVDQPLTGARVPGDTMTLGGSRLVARALSDVRAQGEPFFLWPDSSPVDSLRFALVFTHPRVTREGKIIPDSRLDARAAFLVFSIQTPWDTPAIAKKGNRSPRYPDQAKHMGMSATVFTQFVIDTVGRALPSTIKIIYPRGMKAPVGNRAVVYRTFVDAVKDAVRDMRFSPATIGGCPVRILALQPFEFSIGH